MIGLEKILTLLEGISKKDLEKELEKESDEDIRKLKVLLRESREKIQEIFQRDADARLERLKTAEHDADYKYDLSCCDAYLYCMIEIEYDGLEIEGLFKRVFYKDVTNIDLRIGKFFNKGKFRPARVNLSLKGKAFQFEYGRHRTRWLIESGVKKIPLCLLKTDLERFMELNRYKKVEEDDRKIVKLVKENF